MRVRIFNRKGFSQIVPTLIRVQFTSKPSRKRRFSRADAPFDCNACVHVDHYVVAANASTYAGLLRTLRQRCCNGYARHLYPHSNHTEVEAQIVWTSFEDVIFNDNPSGLMPSHCSLSEVHKTSISSVRFMYPLDSLSRMWPAFFLDIRDDVKQVRLPPFRRKWPYLRRYALAHAPWFSFTSIESVMDWKACLLTSLLQAERDCDLAMNRDDSCWFPILNKHGT